MITREPQNFDPPVNTIAALGRRVIGACQGSGRALLAPGSLWRALSDFIRPLQQQPR